MNLKFRNQLFLILKKQRRESDGRPDFLHPITLISAKKPYNIIGIKKIFFLHKKVPAPGFDPSAPAENPKHAPEGRITWFSLVCEKTEIYRYLVYNAL